MSNVVVLLTGPAGVGTSTLARQIADDRGWAGVSEDTYWSDRGWDTGPRSPVRVIVLTASVRSIVDRAGIRGRPGDLERVSESRRHAARQVKLLESAAMRSYKIIDTTDLSVDEVRRACAVALS